MNGNSDFLSYKESKVCNYGYFALHTPMPFTSETCMICSLLYMISVKSLPFEFELLENVIC